MVLRPPPGGNGPSPAARWPSSSGPCFSAVFGTAPEGGLAGCASLAAARGWWLAEVEVAGVSEDGRRWLLAHPVGPDESDHRILRLDLPAWVLACPGCPAAEPGTVLTVLFKGDSVVAIIG